MLEGVAVVADMAVGVVVIDKEVVVVCKYVARCYIRRRKLYLLWLGNLVDLLVVVGKVATCLVAEV